MFRFFQSRTIGIVALCLSSIGLGSALHVPAVADQAYQTIIAPMITGTCASSNACDQQTNTSNGPGFKGISAGGNGAVGQTEFKSTTSTNFHAGVLGQDISTSGSFDAGVFGKSSNGAGVEGSSTNGIGVQANSANWVGVNAVGGGAFNFTSLPALSVVAGPGGGGVLMAGCSSASDSPCSDTSTSRIFYMDTSGNLNLSGEVFTAGSCSSGCVSHGQASRRVVSYVDHQTVPSMEDFGEAQLVNGRAFVALSSDFANVIDDRSGYLVFITPEGDSNGLFVTQKTHTGFAVRENKNGHSTFNFSYRIVAKPFGENRPRLPMDIRQIRSRS